eukprot:tig00021071_g17959.t1
MEVGSGHLAPLAPPPRAALRALRASRGRAAERGGSVSLQVALHGRGGVDGELAGSRHLERTRARGVRGELTGSRHLERTRARGVRGELAGSRHLERYQKARPGPRAPAVF